MATRSFAGVGALAVALLFGAACMDTQGLTDLPQTPIASPVQWVLVQPAVATVAPGKNIALSVELQDAAGRDLDEPVQWASSDTTVATVDTAGVVTARHVGSANISAQSGGTSAYAVVDVSNAPPPTWFVSITPASSSVQVRATVQLFATVKDSAGNVVPQAQVTWSSSKTAVATVNQSGEITGVDTGSANIVAKAGATSSTARISVTAASSQPPASPPPPPPAPPPSSTTLFNDFSATSPHWSHIRSMMTDFYYGWTASERTWAGQHYDLAISGDGSAWQQANPTVRHLVYALLWTTKVGDASSGPTTSYYQDMQTWYAAHTQYKIETAFLHAASAGKDSASRLALTIWNSSRWAVNPADAGLRAYELDRFARLTANESGVFIDEITSADMLSAASQSSEFGSATGGYQSAMTSLIGAIKRQMGSDVLMLNTATYTTDFDRANAIAAGAVHLEKMNNPLFSETYRAWQWIDDLTANGVLVDFVSAYSSSEIPAMASRVPPGNSATSTQRMKLWELASYYLVVRAQPDLLGLQLENMWNLPYSSIWTRAQEANIGHPLADRVIMSRGTDPAGQGYTLFSRQFDRALVLVRHQSGWGTQLYGDQTAITVPLPGGETWLPLHADGTLGSAVTTIKLRNSEAAILIKGSKVQ